MGQYKKIKENAKERYDRGEGWRAGIKGGNKRLVVVIVM